MIKFLYDFQDWNLYDIIEVEIIDDNYVLKNHPDDHFMLVKYLEGYREGKVGPELASCLFDTRQDADNYGKNKSSCFGG